MPRPVTLFTGQWTDLPLATMMEKVGAWGYDGLELSCSADHFDQCNIAEQARATLMGRHLDQGSIGELIELYGCSKKLTDGCGRRV